MNSLNGSDQSHSSVLFSPLPSHQSTPSQAHTSHPHTPSPSQDPTLLTISAKDIEGGITEYANLESILSMRSVSLNPTANSSSNNENMLATPITPPTVPIRVRVSTKKLREIQSPYNSSVSSIEGSLIGGLGVKQGPLGDPHTPAVSLPSLGDPLITSSKELSVCNQPLVSGTLTPQGVNKKQELGIPQQSKANSKKVSLRQGVLHTRPEPTEAPNTSCDGMVIHSCDPSVERQTVQSSRDKLLHRKSNGIGSSMTKAPYHVKPVMLSDSQKFPGKKSQTNQKAVDDQIVKQSGGAAEGNFHQETAKLVATCTAAATAALLATQQKPTKSEGPASSNNHTRPPQEDSHKCHQTQEASNKLHEGKEQVARKVTHHEPIVPGLQLHSTSGIDQTFAGKTKSTGVQTHSNGKYLQNNENMTSRPSDNNVHTFRRSSFAPTSSIHDEQYSEAHWSYDPSNIEGGRWRDCGVLPGYTDLLTRLNRVEELQHSRLMRMNKISMETEPTQLPQHSHGNGSQNLTKNRIVSLKRDMCSQTSPHGDTPNVTAHHGFPGSKHHLSHSVPRLTDDMKANRALEESDSPSDHDQSRTSSRISKENTSLHSPPTHQKTFMTRPQTSVPEHPTRLEDPSNTEDGVLCVAKVLSNVQQARVDIELECALAEAQEHYTDLGKLLHSAETSNNYEEFNNVSWKVARLMENASRQEEREVLLEEDKTEARAVGSSNRKAIGRNRQRKEPVVRSMAKANRNQDAKHNKQRNSKKPTTATKPSIKSTLPPHPTRVEPLQHPFKASLHSAAKSGALWAKKPTAITNPPSYLHTAVTSPPTHSHTHLPSHPVVTGHPHTIVTGPLSHPHTAITGHPHTIVTDPPTHPHTPTPLPSQWPVIPIAPPCVTPSPIYFIHGTGPQDKQKPHARSDKFTNTSTPPPAAKEQAVVSTVDACLQTSFSHTPENYEVVSVTAHNDKETNSMTEPHEAVLSSQSESPDDLNSEGSVEPTVTITGCCHHSPSRTTLSSHPPPASHSPQISHPPPASHSPQILHPPPSSHGPQTSHCTHCAQERVCSDQLSEQLQQQLESRAVECLRQELTMRMLSQMKPLKVLSDSDHSNSCSTCSLNLPSTTPIEVKFSATHGQRMDNATVLSSVKEAVKLELLSLAQEMITAKEKAGKDSNVIHESENEYNYTPPESFTPSSTLTNTEPHLLSTPHTTPPVSRTLTPENTLTCQGIELVSTPPLTPPRKKSPLSTQAVLIATPQETTDEESNVSDSTHKITHLPQSIATPQTTPTSNPISAKSPPQSPGEPTPPVVVKSLPVQHARELSISDETSTTSMSSHHHTSTSSHDHTLTSSTSSTDRAISFGECISNKLHLPAVNASLSEGEVPLSPGDVRWGALFTKANPVMEAFLELKHSEDSLSDSEDPSQVQCFSAGEVGRSKVQLVDPFEKFLRKMNTSTPEDTSSYTRESISAENTLSELPSINIDNHNSLAPDITPAVTRLRKLPLSGDSPGEVLSLSSKDRREDASISFPHSDGEVPKILRTYQSNRQSQRTQFNMSMDTVNEMRNGIDVINLSQLKPQSSSTTSPNDTLASVSQISVKSSPPKEKSEPILLLVQPAPQTQLEQSDPNKSEGTDVTSQAPLQPALKVLSSPEELPLDISLSELELTNTISKTQLKKDNITDLPHQLATAPLPFPHRVSINVNIPMVSEEVSELRTTESSSSDFDFTSSMSIPSIN